MLDVLSNDILISPIMSDVLSTDILISHIMLDVLSNKIVQSVTENFAATFTNSDNCHHYYNPKITYAYTMYEDVLVLLFLLCMMYLLLADY